MGLKNFLEPFLRKAATAPDAQMDAGGGAAVLEMQAPAAVKPKYRRISAREAKAVMDSGEAATVLDVREPYEYKEGHIKNAVLLPSGSVAADAERLLPDKDAKILVYCLSGARSGSAARQLVRLGYTQVYDFGGILHWPYNVVTQ